MTAKEKAQAEKQNDPTIEQKAGDVIAEQDGIAPEEVLPEGHVKVKLAHPLTKEADLIYLGLDPTKSYGVNDDITVLRRAAKALISAGFVQCDPEDAEAVKSLLAAPGPKGGTTRK